MPTGTIILLGAFAGLTIFLGLPLAFLKKIPPSLKIFLCMLATGILIFPTLRCYSESQRTHQRRHRTGAYTTYGYWNPLP